MYSIDWMQVYCLDLIQGRDYESLKGGTIISNETNKYGYHTQFTLCAPHEYIVGYEWQQTVIYKNFTVATIAAVPRDKNKDKRGCAIKLANPVLYTQGWYDLLKDIASAMRWQVHNITRVDLAADFNYFLNGLYPETFIRKYIFKGGDGFVRVGGNKYTLNGEREIVRSNLNTIRWGSRQSGVSVYLYNKSLELEQKKDKPWIRYAWEKAGIADKTVWRVEFSISNQGCDMRDISNGLLHTLFIDDLNLQDAVRQYWCVFAKKYFHFKVVKRGGAVRKKDMQDAELLPMDEELRLKPTTPSRLKECGKTDKVLMNYLEKMQDFVMAGDDADKYGILESIHNVRTYMDLTMTYKKKSNEQEKAILDLAKQFSLDTLRQRLKLATKYAENRRLIDDISRTVVAEVIKKVDDLPMTEDARKRIHLDEEPTTPPTPEDIETALLGTL